MLPDQREHRAVAYGGAVFGRERQDQRAEIVDGRSPAKFLETTCYAADAA
jgi:hypothetical protein